MSYGGVENTQDELDLLKGAKILSVTIEDQPEDLAEFPGDNRLVMKVQLPNAIELVSPEDNSTKVTRTVTFEIWMDAEGNGPGFLSLVG